MGSREFILVSKRARADGPISVIMLGIPRDNTPCKQALGARGERQKLRT